MEIELEVKYLGFLLALVLGGLLLYFSLKTDFLGEDEILYVELGELLSTGRLPAYFREIRPRPLSYSLGVPLLYAALFTVFGVSLSLAKFTSALFALGTLVLVYLSGRELMPATTWGKQEFLSVGALSAVVLLFSMPIFNHHALLAYVDVPIAFMSALAFYCFLKLDSYKRAVLTGVVLGLAFYIKGTSVALPVFLVIYGAYRYFLEDDQEFLKYVLVSCGVAGAILLPWLLRNFINFGYPFFEGLNFFFERPESIAQPSWFGPLFGEISPTLNLLGSLGIVPGLAALLAFLYFLFTQERKLLLPFIFILLFSFIFLFFLVTGLLVVESRYLMLILPQLALAGGYFFDTLFKEEKLFSLLILILLFWSAFLGFKNAQATTRMRRWSPQYIAALDYIESEVSKKENTSVVGVFTAYGGSVKYYSGQENVWAMEEFPQLMTTTDGEFIYETLRAYNVTYILVSRSILAERWVIPESNIIGVFTTRFVDVITNDKEHFQAEFWNDDSIVYKLKGLE